MLYCIRKKIKTPTWRLFVLDAGTENAGGWGWGKKYKQRWGGVPKEDGYKNLIPMNERSEDDQRRIKSAGGIASGVARRRKKSLKEAADLYLSLPVSDQRRWNKIAKKGVDPGDVDNQMAMIIGLVEAATLGDAKAARIIIDLLGENAKEDDGGGVAIVDDIS